MTHAAPVPVICLAGPTGSGKTAAALALARACNGEVINADSRQAYHDFPIITAQPFPEERAVCPHHLYGFLPTAAKMAAGSWAEEAASLARDIWARGHVPLAVGGTGLYFKALLHGIAAIPPVSAALSEELAARCAACGSPALHAELSAVDPAYAARIHPNDRQRVLRALEVWLGTGKTFSWWHAHAAPAPLAQGPLLGLGITLDELTPRLGRRIDAMLEMGALEEARQAHLLCSDPAAPGWSGIGCAELLAHLEGRLSLPQARVLWMSNTRAYAKRQLTWFRAQPKLEWFSPQDVAALTDRVLRAVDGLRSAAISCAADQAQ